MDKTAFRLKVAGVALLLASSIATVIIVAQRPSGDSAAHRTTSGDTVVSHNQ